MVDAVVIIEQLDPAEIESRLEQLRGEQKALRVLLRAAYSRDRHRAARGGTDSDGSAPADHQTQEARP
jgi:hypothetical protein